MRNGEHAADAEPMVIPRRAFAPGGFVSIREMPGGLLLALIVAVAGLAFLALRPPLAVAQATVNGLVAGSYYGLGALGLTLVYGILRLVNFAHGDFLTFGAYVTLAMLALGLPLVPAVLVAVLASAALGVALEFILWRPVRRAGANLLQLFLVSIGLAMALRYGIQFFAGSQIRTLGADTLSSVNFLGLHLGTLQLAVIVAGLLAMAAVGLMLALSRIGKEMRAVADNIALAEVSGIDTGRIVIATWIVSAGLAGLAGALYAAAIGSMNPNFGFTLLLGLFAAAVLGGIGNAYGALLGGVLIGLFQEWATLFFNARWKPAVGFVILILALLIVPNGIFGRSRRVS